MFQHEIRQTSYFADNVVVGLPMMFSGAMPHAELCIQLRAVAYPAAVAQYRYDTTRKGTPVVNVSVSDAMNATAAVTIMQNPQSQNQPQSKYQNQNQNQKQHQRPTTYVDYAAIRSGRVRVPDATFIVKADLQNDVYRVCTSDGGAHGFAAIQTYETSKFMNKLFRRIKENDNLDLLEQSDDEDEFENVSPDKYVNLDKTCKLVCKYLPKLNKWCPYKVASSGRGEFCRVATDADVVNLGRDPSLRHAT